MQGDGATPRPGPQDFRLTWAEISGALGDLGLFLPLVIAVTIQVRLDLGIVFAAAGLMCVVAAFVFRQPIPAQPMKAIAAVAITEGMTQGALTASGLILGAMLLALALTGLVDRFRTWIPNAVVRGVQLGIGLKLAAKGAGWVAELPWFGWDSIAIGVVVAILLLGLMARRLSGLVPVFVAGLLIVVVSEPATWGGVQLGLPAFIPHWPTSPEFTDGLVRVALPQLPLTLLNSVLAVCALSADYFPGRGVAPKRMAATIGLVNAVCAPFGAIPMCHGSGGLAAQYRFGARTGGAVLFLGLLLIGIGLTFGSTLLPVLDAYPMSILGVMLVFAGVELARAARDVASGRQVVVALITAACILGVNTGVGFLAGFAFHLATSRRSQTGPSTPAST